jgi:hypothetical protein
MEGQIKTSFVAKKNVYKRKLLIEKKPKDNLDLIIFNFSGITSNY